MLEIEPSSYNKHKPPTISSFKDGEVTLMKTIVNASVNVSSVLDVDQDDATFTILFSLNLKWKDPYLKFNYLKRRKQQNHITEKFSNSIWMPSIKFLLGKMYFNKSKYFRLNGLMRKS